MVQATNKSGKDGAERTNGERVERGNLNNGTTPNKTQPPAPAVTTVQELRAMQAGLNRGPYTGGTKPTTQVFAVYAGKVHKGTVAGHPADGSAAALHSHVLNAPAVNMSGPTGGEYADPTTGKPKAAGTVKDVVPGASVAPFLADVVLPVA